ncbi:MAG: biopolymer transporter ExbD [Neisseriaceae bacterium]|nr:biopolymer transporter ExbD [Neisseriaceae bacterium]
MNFRRRRKYEEPEINFIPLIDVLLVILIFLMVTTSYSRFTALDIKLPEAVAAQAPEASAQQPIWVGVAKDGRWLVDQIQVDGEDEAALQSALKARLAAEAQPLVVIQADAEASHQSVVKVMEAARAVGISDLSFATEKNE